MYETIKEILYEIQIKREKMIYCAQKSGIKSLDTLRYSQELDQLIYQVQRINKDHILQKEENYSI